MIPQEQSSGFQEDVFPWHQARAQGGPACRVTIKMVLSVTVAVLVARTLLQGAARMLAKHATDELYQLTVIAFCLVGAWISGYLVRLDSGGR